MSKGKRKSRRSRRKKVGASPERPALFRCLAAGARGLWRGLKKAVLAVDALLIRCWAGLFLLFVLGASALLLSAVVSVGMVDVTQDYILTPQEAGEETQDFDCILVLGAGLREDGSPSPMLYDRILTSVELYKLLNGEDGADGTRSPIPLVMSGDRTGDYNEPAVMKSTAVSLGASSDRVFTDFEGYSTYESIQRLRDLYGVRRVLIVTQEYHLYRAVYIARRLGLDAWGVASDKRPYRAQLWRASREMLARYKDFFTSARGELLPVSGTPVDLSGNADAAPEEGGSVRDHVCN